MNVEMINSEINLLASTTGEILINLKSEGLHKKHAVTTWNQETISALD
jgi:hypothetical protein